MRVIRAEQLTRTADSAHARLADQCVHAARCEVAGVVMELRSDDARVAQVFGLRYADHVATREPDFRYYVATIRGGYAFWCDHAPAWRWSQGALPPDAIVFLADGVALSALVRYDAGLASMQAAGVEFRGVAAAIAGSSVAARVTTMLACARRGMRVYSDERVILRGSTVHPFLRRCSVRAAGARLLLADRESEAVEAALRDAPALSMRTCFGSEALAEPRPLRALFTLAGVAGCASLEEIDAAAALPSVSRWFESRGDIMDRVTRAISLLRGVRSFKLVVGSPDETAAAIAYAMSTVAS